MRVSAFVTFQVHQSDVMSDLTFSFFFGNPLSTQTKVDIVVNRFPWKQSKLLENNRSIWTRPRHQNIVDLHATSAWKFKTRGHTHAGCFPAARWTNDNHEFFVLNCEVDVVKDKKVLTVALENAADVAELDSGHVNYFCKKVFSSIPVSKQDLFQTSNQYVDHHANCTDGNHSHHHCVGSQGALCAQNQITHSAASDDEFSTNKRQPP